MDQIFAYAPITTCEVEHFFSTSTLMCSPRRSALSPHSLKKLAFIRYNNSAKHKTMVSPACERESMLSGILDGGLGDDYGESSDEVSDAADEQ